VRTAFPDLGGDGMGHRQQLEYRDTPAIGRGHELLRDHVAQRARELLADVQLLRIVERVDDAVDRHRGGAAVQRRHDEVARVGRRERKADRFTVTHLAHQDDVRAAAEGGRSPEAKLSTCVPISRWWMTARRGRKTYSIGSSSVTMWQARAPFSHSSSAASVVDLRIPSPR
jgi:hypothetical protein